MDLDEVLGIDWTDPAEQNAAQLVAADEGLLDDLIRLRCEQGLKQQDVADRLGVAQPSIARIESGERDPHLSTLRRYALAVGARVEHKVSRFEAARPSDHWVDEVRDQLLPKDVGASDDWQDYGESVSQALACGPWRA